MTDHAVRVTGLAVLLLAAMGSRAAGQDTARVTAVSALRPGQQVRVDLLRAGRDQGRFVAANDTAFTLTRGGVSTTLRLAHLERLWVRGRATARGALIGAGVGFAIPIWRSRFP